MLHSLAGELKSISQIQDEEQLAKLLPCGKRPRAVMLGSTAEIQCCKNPAVLLGCLFRGAHCRRHGTILPSSLAVAGSWLKNDFHTLGKILLSWEKPNEVEKRVTEGVENLPLRKG